jgi:hypothetical protein
MMHPIQSTLKLHNQPNWSMTPKTNRQAVIKSDMPVVTKSKCRTTVQEQRDRVARILNPGLQTHSMMRR